MPMVRRNVWARRDGLRALVGSWASLCPRVRRRPHTQDFMSHRACYYIYGNAIGLSAGLTPCLAAIWGSRSL
jgi:hypothetical protein